MSDLVLEMAGGPVVFAEPRTPSLPLSSVFPCLDCGNVGAANVVKAGEPARLCDRCSEAAHGEALRLDLAFDKARKATAERAAKKAERERKASRSVRAKKLPAPNAPPVEVAEYIRETAPQGSLFPPAPPTAPPSGVCPKCEGSCIEDSKADTCSVLCKLCKGTGRA